MKMENGTGSSSSIIPYTNGTTAKPLQQQQMTNAVSMESLDSAISTSNGNGGGGSGSCDQVRTLFVSGLPIDVKPRELYLLFRAYPGYESSQLKLTQSGKNGALSKASTPVGFVTFITKQDAEEARKKLQGVRFDPDQPQTIRLELARSNTKVTTKASKQPSPPNHNIGINTAANPNMVMQSALLPPPVPNTVLSHNMAAVAQLAALQQQQQQLAAAAVLLNQQHHHHDNAQNSTNNSIAQQQQQLLAAAAVALDHQRHLSPLLTANGPSADMQQQLAALVAAHNNTNPTALAAFSHHHAQQAQAVQQILQLQQHQNQTNSAAAAAVALLGAPGLSGTTNTNPQQFAAVTTQFMPMQNQQTQHFATNASNSNGALTAPCSTIFVGNLGPTATTAPQTVEDELRTLFGMFPGFSRIRMHAKSGAPVAFVEFSEVAQAMAAMHAMQGYCLSANGGVATSTGNNGIRIEFAKTRMGDTSSGQQQRGDAAPLGK